jgi:Uma2 family endonuclease
MAAVTKRSAKSIESRPTITDKAIYEIVNGRLEEMEPMSVYAMSIAIILATEIRKFVEPRGLGWVTMETLFLLSPASPRSRRPDVAFVSAARWPLDKPLPLTGESWDVVPDLAVEVVSPNDRVSKFQLKLKEYFQAGVRHVWVVHPETQTVEVYLSRQDIRVFEAHDELADEETLPGFRLPVASIFPPHVQPATKP